MYMMHGYIQTTFMFVELKGEFPSDQRRSDVMSCVKVKLEVIAWKHACV